jgi:hypothetical protein
MNIIPYDKLLITTRQEINFVRERLISKTETWQNESLRMYKDFKESRYSDSTKFELKITNNKFTLRRISDRYYRNGLRPIVKGHLKTDNGKTLIQVTIRQHFTTILFYGLWCIIMLFLFVLGLSNNKSLSVTTATFFIIGYSFCLYGYNSEIEKYKKFLRDTFNLDNGLPNE